MTQRYRSRIGSFLVVLLTLLAACARPAPVKSASQATPENKTPQPEYQRWDYMVMVVLQQPVPSGWSMEYDSSLDGAGGAGWELVSAVTNATSGVNSYITLIFKRPLRDSTSEY